MQQLFKYGISLLAAAFMLCACSKKVKEREDKIYSRHLQEHFTLSIISTPVPDDKSEMNLLLLTDGQDITQLKVKETISDLYKRKLIQPLMVVAVNPASKNDVYGVAGYPDYQNRGSKADKFSDFIDDELYAFIKKKAVIRKFNSVTIAGSSLAGLSAFDIAWDHADKIDKVGVFSGAFGLADKSKETPGYSDKTDRLIFNKIKSSRKKPHLKYWFYGDDVIDTSNHYKDSIPVSHTADLAEFIKSKNVCPPGDIVYTPGGHDNYEKAFADFLLWAVGK